MALEVVNHIGDLSINDPIGGDPKGQGDDHIRNIKKALKADLIVEHEISGANAGAHKFKFGNTASRPAAGVAGRPYLNTELHMLQRDTGTVWEDVPGQPRYAVDSSAVANQITAAFSPVSPALTFNQVLFIRVAVANTGAVNANIDGLGNLEIKKYVGGALVSLESGDLLAGQIIAIKHNPAATAFWQLLSTPAKGVTSTQLTKLDGLKARTKDWGTLTVATTIQLDEADLHLITVGANITLTFASVFSNDKAVVVVKNAANYTTTLAGIDHDSPTLTIGTSIQDFIALIKSFGKISCVSAVLNRATL